jgi:hypothetical protein
MIDGKIMMSFGQRISDFGFHGNSGMFHRR